MHQTSFPCIVVTSCVEDKKKSGYKGKLTIIHLPPKKEEEEKESGNFQGRKRLDLGRSWDGKRLEAVGKKE